MAEEPESKTDKKGGKGLTMILAAAVVVAMLVGGAFAFVQFLVPKDDTPEADGGGTQANTDQWTTATYQIPLQYVNLAETKGKRYLKVGCTVEFSAMDPEGERERIQEREILIQDSLITLLSGKTIDDIDGAENKRFLKAEIIEILSGLMFPDPSQGKVEQVYYYEFLVQ